MRDSSLVSAPLGSCDALSSTSASSTKRYLALRLLDQQTLYFLVEPKAKTKELYNQICIHLAARGMVCTDLFGVAALIEHEYLFVDPESKLSKYAPKNWRSSSTRGLDNVKKPLLTFYFRVQFYVENPLLLGDELTRHFYYLQLRQNVVSREQFYACIPAQVIHQLAGLALQADFGDYTEIEQLEKRYFHLRDYFPQQMLAGSDENDLYKLATGVHRAYTALSKVEAETQFIREASSRETFPVAHNSHLYSLKMRKSDPDPGSLWLAICTRGIELYQEKCNQLISGTFTWNNIGKLCFDRKKFEIRSLNPPGERQTYYTSSDDKSKHLLTLCRLTHQFCMSMQPKLMDLNKKEKEGQTLWNADMSVKLGDVCYTNTAEQRISVVSNTSSNTTSGIVSDRVQSIGESEDDLDDLEIMINCPPAVSVESLALAHLRDSFHRSSKRSSSDLVPLTPTSTCTSILESDSDGDNRKTTKSSPISNKTTLSITPTALTEGSQCSSSCSTVVVNGPNAINEESTNAQRDASKEEERERRLSTSSSLELGYSHTAQNSAMSDSTSCYLEMEFSARSTAQASASSGIYTMRSTCETNTNTAASAATTVGTAACSSQTSGICHSEEGADLEVDEPRTRSSSISSTAGSFHGDGSDPSDTGHAMPLTADELSDLIVGKTRKPLKGKYPAVATVSETLDSIADYVTLPPPPSRTLLPPPQPKDYIATLTSTLSSNNLEDSSASLQNLADNKFLTEELRLQRQIQFQHLASNYTPHLLMETLPGHSLVAKPQYTSYLHQQQKRNYNTLESVPFSLAARDECERNASRKRDLMNFEAHPLRSHKSCFSLRVCEDETQNGVLNWNRSQNLVYAPQRDVNLQNNRSEDRYVPTPKPPSNWHPNFSQFVGSNNYLDYRSGAAFLEQIHRKFPPPPPLSNNRQPPPPPPRVDSQYIENLAHQMRQYKQQLYSDVDYVMFPMRDPAVSRQEYVECKQMMSQQGLTTPPPPYPDKYELYRSAPNVAVISNGLIPNLIPCRDQIKYASNQNISQIGALSAALPPMGGQFRYASNQNVSQMGVLAGLPPIASQLKYASNSNVSQMGPLSAALPPMGAQYKYASNQNVSQVGALSAALPPMGAHYKYSSNHNVSQIRALSAAQPPIGGRYNYASNQNVSQMGMLTGLPPMGGQLPQQYPLYSSAYSNYSDYSPSLQSDQASNIMRTYSDDNILNSTSLRTRKDISLSAYNHVNRPLPTPPSSAVAAVRRSKKGDNIQLPKCSQNESPENINNVNKSEPLDIRFLREKSKNLDLPLISALCNDRSLLQQTKAKEFSSKMSAKKEKDCTESKQDQTESSQNQTDIEQNQAKSKHNQKETAQNHIKSTQNEIEGQKEIDGEEKQKESAQKQTKLKPNKQTSQMESIIKDNNAQANAKLKQCNSNSFENECKLILNSSNHAQSVSNLARPNLRPISWYGVTHSLKLQPSSVCQPLDKADSAETAGENKIKKSTIAKTSNVLSTPMRTLTKQLSNYSNNSGSKLKYPVSKISDKSCAAVFEKNSIKSKLLCSNGIRIVNNNNNSVSTNDNSDGNSKVKVKTKAKNSHCTKSLSNS